MEEFQSIPELTTEGNAYKNAVKTLKTVICATDTNDNAEMKFMAIRPLPNETTLGTLKRLSKAAQLCGFDHPDQEIMRVALAIILDDRWRARKLSQGWTKANFAEAMKFAKEQEQLQVEKQEILSANTDINGEVKAVQKEQKEGRPCRFCGITHEYGRCAAYNQTCSNCGLLHHFARCCNTPNPVTGFKPRGNQQGGFSNNIRGYGRGFENGYGRNFGRGYYQQPRPQHQGYRPPNYGPRMQQNQRPSFGQPGMSYPRPQGSFGQQRRFPQPNRGSSPWNRGRGRGFRPSGQVRLIDQEYGMYEEYDQDYHYIRSIDPDYNPDQYEESITEPYGTFEYDYGDNDSGEQLAIETMLSPTAIEFHPSTDQDQHHQSSSQNHQQEQQGSNEINDTFYEAVKSIRLE